MFPHLISFHLYTDCISSFHRKKAVLGNVSSKQLHQSGRVTTFLEGLVTKYLVKAIIIFSFIVPTLQMFLFSHISLCGSIIFFTQFEKLSDFKFLWLLEGVGVWLHESFCSLQVGINPQVLLFMS